MQLPCPIDTLSNCKCVFVLPLSDLPPPPPGSKTEIALLFAYMLGSAFFGPSVAFCSCFCLWPLFNPFVLSNLFCPEILFSSPFISLFFFLLLIPSCYQLGTSRLGQSGQQQHPTPLGGLVCPQRMAPERIPLTTLSVLWSRQSNFWLSEKSHTHTHTHTRTHTCTHICNNFLIWKMHKSKVCSSVSYYKIKYTCIISHVNRETLLMPSRSPPVLFFSLHQKFITLLTAHTLDWFCVFWDIACINAQFIMH